MVLTQDFLRTLTKAFKKKRDEYITQAVKSNSAIYCAYLKGKEDALSDTIDILNDILFMLKCSDNCKSNFEQ